MDLLFSGLDFEELWLGLKTLEFYTHNLGILKYVYVKKVKELLHRNRFWSLCSFV